MMRFEKVDNNNMDTHHNHHHLNNHNNLHKMVMTSTEECDSTTTVLDNGNKLFQVGEDVFFQDDAGQNVLGTVGLIQGKKMKLIFMDETEKWTHVSRVKKISFSFEDEGGGGGSGDNQAAAGLCDLKTSYDVVSLVNNKGKQKSSGKRQQKEGKETYQVTCGSCGTEKVITSKKAVEYTPFTNRTYNCRKCINKSKTSKNNGMIAAAVHSFMQQQNEGHHHNHRNNSSVSNSRGRPPKQNGIMPSSSKQFCNNKVKHPHQQQQPDVCLHCRGQIMERVSLHCTMCERPCHPSCLALTPTPLPGDIFWSIICHVCGTQKSTNNEFMLNGGGGGGISEHDAQKLYSSRRSLTCWSDVAYLLLSCMGCCSTNKRTAIDAQQQFFDLDEHVIPFWDENLARLHLPRQYKLADPTDRRRNLLVALTNANLRFIKHPLNGNSPSSKTLFAIKDTRLLTSSPSVPNHQNSNALITIRPTNPEATSAAMSSIAQTIAAQSKTSSTIPSPKNSPKGKSNLHVNKQTSPVMTTKRVECLTPSPGGSARVTGIHQQSLSPNKSNQSTAADYQVTKQQSSSGGIACFPVRKNGSPIIMSKSMRVETIIPNDKVKIGGGSGGSSSNGAVKRKLHSPSPAENGANKKQKHSSMLVTPISATSSSPVGKKVQQPMVPKSPPKQMTTLQKLSDLEKNAGLTVVRRVDNNTGMSSSSSSSSSTSTVELIRGKGAAEEEENVDTKDNVVVTTNSNVMPSNGEKKTETKKMSTRPVRVKKPVVQPKVEETTTSTKKSAAVPKNNINGKVIRGRPKRKASVTGGSVLCGNCGGSAAAAENNGDEVIDEATKDVIWSSWERASVKDLVNFGIGYRIGVLPRADEARAVGYLKSEAEGVSSAAVSCGGGGDNKRDLEMTDSYVVRGRRKVLGGNYEYQVLWGVGQDDDDEDGGGGAQPFWLTFEDFDYVEHFKDCLNLNGSDVDAVVVKTEKVDNEVAGPPPIANDTDADVVDLLSDDDEGETKKKKEKTPIVFVDLTDDD